MRKLPALLLMLVLLLAACGGGDGGDAGSEAGEESSAAPSDEASSEESSEAAAGEFTPMEDGVLIVGTELPAPPFWIGDDYDSIEGGYEYDLAVEIANRLGLDEVRVVEMPFAGLVAGQECPCDIDFSQVTITDERAQVVDFSTPYFDANQGVLVREGTEVASIEDARTLQWGAQINTTAIDYLDSTLQPETEAQIYNTVVDAFTALRAEQIDAVMLDTPIVLGEAARPDSGLEVVAQFETGEQYGAVLPKDSPNTATIDAIIEELESEGFLDELGAEYFNDPASVPVLG
jgi:polar amino acid transport system substrate-binding protein